jgi:CRP-like cAMP-binding protein
MTSATRSQFSENALLAVLHEDDHARLEPHMHALEMPKDSVLQRAGEDVIDTWFPCGPALAAFCITNSEGQSVDVGFIGREGALGGIVSNGHIPAYATATVRASGTFLRIKTTALEQAKVESLPLRHWFSRYSDCLLAQVFQTAACNATHTIKQRIAKLILGGHARTGETALPLTQEQLADMLGVGRTFVSRVIGTMRAEGIIESRRGTLIIRDLSALRSESCTCATAIEDHFDTVLHGIYPPPV